MPVTIRSRKPLGLNPLLVATLGICPALAAANGLHQALLLASGILIVQLCSIVLLAGLRRFIVPRLSLLFIVTVAGGWTTLWAMVAHAKFPELFSSIALYAYLTPSLLPIVYLAQWLDPDSGKPTGLSSCIQAALLSCAALCAISALRELIGAGTLGEETVFARPLCSWFTTIPGTLVITSAITGCAALIQSHRIAPPENVPQ